MRILMINLPYAGHPNPTLPLCRELLRRGHEITYINAESFRRRIEETGAAFVPYRGFPDEPSDDYIKRNCFRAAFDTAMALTDRFDLLIFEMFFYPGIEVAKRKEIPCVRQFSQTAWSEATWKAAPGVFRLSAKLIDRQRRPAHGLCALESARRHHRTPSGSEHRLRARDVPERALVL